MSRRSLLWWIFALAVALAAAVLWSRRPESTGESVRLTAPSLAVDRGSLPEEPIERIPEVESRREPVATARLDAPLHLSFRRLHDHQPVRPHAIEVTHADAALTCEPIGDGRFRMARPTDDGALVIQVPRHEPETVEQERWERVEELEVLLRPVDGLFGRVVEVDGTPAAGVPVVAMRPGLAADVQSRPGQPPRMRVLERHEQVGVAISDADGWYRIDAPTRDPAEPLLLRAAASVGRIAELRIELPREAEPLPDLVLGGFPSVGVLVQDESGAPLAGIGLNASLPTFLLVDETGGFALRTGADGRCSIPAWSLPTSIRPMAPGWQPVGVRIDGLEVRPETPIERVGQELVWILRRAACVDVRVVDASTRAQLDRIELRLRPMRDGRPAGDLHALSMSPDGTMCFGFFSESSAPWFASEAPDYDAIEVSAHVGGYEPVQRSVSRAELPPGGTLVLEIEPSATTHYVTGRVLDAGAPVPRARVAVAAAPGADPGRVLSGERSQGETDREGRFSLLWAADACDAQVIVHARGRPEGGVASSPPLDPARARDLTLEFEPTLDVLVRLVGAQSGDALPLLVEIDADGNWQYGWDTQVRATRIDAGGLGATLALPAHRPSRVTLLLRSGGANSEPVVFDPASPRTSLQFDASRPRASLRGLALVPVGAGPREHGVVLVPTSGAPLANAIDVRGGFAFRDVTPGSCELYLVRTEANGMAKVLGRQTIQLDADRDDVVLVANER